MKKRRRARPDDILLALGYGSLMAEQCNEWFTFRFDFVKLKVN